MGETPALMLSPSHRKRRWTESIDMRPVISVIVTEWRRGLKNCNRGEGNKHVLREYASLARNFLRNKAKMCFSFNLSFRSKPGAGLRRTISSARMGGSVESSLSQ